MNEGTLMKVTNSYNYSKNPVNKPVEAKKKAPQKAVNPTNVKIASLAGSAVAISAAIGGILMALKKGGNPTKFADLRYGEKEVLALGGASIAGGMIAGSIADKNNAKHKLREGIRQFTANLLAPVGCVALGTTLLEKSGLKMPQLKETVKFADKINLALKGLPRAAITVTGLVGGMAVGNKIMSKVNDKLFKEKAGKETKATDYSQHADDLCFASTFMFKNPKIQSVISKVLPATFLIAGMETGTKGLPEKK